MKAGRTAIWVLALLAGATPSARALTGECTASATGTAFGTYQPGSALPLTAIGSVTVSCDNLLGLIALLVSYTIQLSAGSSASFATRQMAGPGYQLSYNLYTDGSYTSVWGNGSAGTATLSDGYLLAVGATATRSYNVHGRMPAGQNVVPGSYADTITVTLNY